MAPRDWSKPKAAQLDADLVLRAIDAYNMGRGPWPPDAFEATFPPNVVLAKMRKLEKQSLVRRGQGGGYFVTEMGQKTITEAD